MVSARLAGARELDHRRDRQLVQLGEGTRVVERGAQLRGERERPPEALVLRGLGAEHRHEIERGALRLAPLRAVARAAKTLAPRLRVRIAALERELRAQPESIESRVGDVVLVSERDRIVEQLHRRARIAAMDREEREHHGILRAIEAVPELGPNAEGIRDAALGACEVT